MIVNKPVDDAAKALAEYFNGQNARSNREAQIKFALVDWVEPEVDPETPEGRYTECVYQAGIRAGFKTFEDLSEGQLHILYPDGF